MKTVSNSFVSGGSIDLNRPPRIPYNPREHEYPKMLYHQTKKDPLWLKEHQRITLYNSLHPEKPELLPVVPFMTVIVKSKEEEQQKLKEGYGLRAPSEEMDEPTEIAASTGKKRAVA